jgi:4-oxalocrotonate tautomerase
MRRNVQGRLSGPVPDVHSAVRAHRCEHRYDKEDSMALIQVKVIAGVFTAPQKREMVERLTDAMVEIEGENMRQTIWCIVEELADGTWGVGGRPLTADDLRALARAAPIASPER